MSKPPFNFDRYINGRVMAEGVTVEKQQTLDDAMRVAAKIASHGPNGEVPVLVYTPPATAVPDDVAGLIAELRVIGCHENGDARCTCGIGMDAADALEAQAAELARKDAALRKLSTAACFGNGEVLGRDLRKDPFGREILARMKIAEAAITQPTGD